MNYTTESKFNGIYNEANRCLNCYDPPCVKNCPAGVEVSRFIKLLSQGDVTGAAEIIEKNNPLGLICGWLCPQESLMSEELHVS